MSLSGDGRIKTLKAFAVWHLFAAIIVGFTDASDTFAR